MRRSLMRDLLVVAALFVLPLVFFWQVTLGSRTLLPADNLYQFQPWAAYRDEVGVPPIAHNNLLSDLVLENLPWKQFIRQNLANRELPLWNPYLFAGVPFLAAGQHSALYPFSALYYVLPLEKAYGWFTVSQLWLAGVLMYLFVRGLGLGRFAGLFSGIAYQMNNFFVASVVFQMIIAAAAWLPFLLLMVELTIRRQKAFGKPTVVPWIGLGAIGLGMEILAGHVEFSYYALLVMGFWSACRLSAHLVTQIRQHQAWQGELLRSAGALLALVVLGLGIGAVQFIPTLELASHNFREGSASFQEVRSYAFPPRHTLAFLMPNLFGSPAQHDYYDVFTGQQQPFNWQRADGSVATDTYWEVGKNYVEGACYVGLLTLLLAAIALLNAWRERAAEARIQTEGPYRVIFLALSVISLLFVFGTVVYGLLYYGLPGMNQLHSPFRWVFPLTLCLSALAGYGMQALQHANSGTQTARYARLIGALAGALGLGVLAALLASRVLFDRIRVPLEGLLHRLAGADTAFPNVETFYSVEFRPVLLFAVFMLASGAVVWLSVSRLRLPGRLSLVPLWQPLAAIVLALDLVMAGAGFNPAADPAWLHYEPPAITWLKQQQPVDWRFTAVEGPTHTMNANVGWLYGLQDVRGYDSIIPKPYVNYMQQIQPQTQLIYNRVAPIFPDQLGALDAPLLDALSVKYVVSEGEIDTTAHPKYRLAYQDKAVRIYENTAALPRAFTVSSSGDACNVDASKLALDQIGKTTLAQTRFTEVSVDVEASPVDATATSGTSTTRCLIVNDSYYNGWRGYIRQLGTSADQEKEVRVQQVAGNFRAVPLPPGAWTIRFRFSPPTFQIGAFGSFIAAVIIILAVLLWLWRLFYVEDAGEAGDVRRFAKNSLAPIFLNLFIRGIDFVFALVMLRILGPADAGTYYYAVVIFGWFDTLTNFGLNLLLTREVARNRSLAAKFLLNSSLLRLALAGLGVPVLIAFLAIQGAIAPANSVAVIAIILLYVGLVPNSISYGLTALFYAFEKAELPAVVGVVIAILKAVFGLAVLLLGWGVIGLAGVSILLNLITLALMGWQARDVLRKYHEEQARNRTATSETNQDQNPSQPAVIDRGLMRNMIRESWPLMLNNLLAGMFFKIDVTLLEPLKGSETVGKYSAAYKWLDALGLVPSLFTMALLPIMSRQAHEDRVGLQRNYHFAVKLLIIVALPIAVVFTFLAPLLIGVLGGARYLPEGAIALQLMAWFLPIGWINSLTNYVLVALDLQRPMRWAFLAGVLFNVVANLIFIPLFSYKAAAIITILSEVVLQIAFYRLLRNALQPVPWISLLWKPVAAAAAMYTVLAVLLPEQPNLRYLIVLVIAAVVYPVGLIALRPFSAWELERVAALVPLRFRRFIQAAASA